MPNAYQKGGKAWKEAYNRALRTTIEAQKRIEKLTASGVLEASEAAADRGMRATTSLLHASDKARTASALSTLSYKELNAQAKAAHSVRYMRKDEFVELDSGEHVTRADVKRLKSNIRKANAARAARIRLIEAYPAIPAFKNAEIEYRAYSRSPTGHYVGTKSGYNRDLGKIELEYQPRNKGEFNAILKASSQWVTRPAEKLMEQRESAAHMIEMRDPDLAAEIRDMTLEEFDYAASRLDFFSVLAAYYHAHIAGTNQTDDAMRAAFFEMSANDYENAVTILHSVKDFYRNQNGHAIMMDNIVRSQDKALKKLALESLDADESAIKSDTIKLLKKEERSAKKGKGKR